MIDYVGYIGARECLLLCATNLGRETYTRPIRFEALHGGISISFRFAVTPCVYLNYREAEVRVVKRTLSHNSYLHGFFSHVKSPWFSLNQKRVARYWFFPWTIISLSDSRDTSCAIRFFSQPVPQLRDSWDKHMVLPQTVTIRETCIHKNVNSWRYLIVVNYIV